MNKKIIVLIITIIVLVLVGFGTWMMNSKSNNESSSNNTSSNTQENNAINNNDNNVENGSKENTSNGKNVAVIYFSASGTTKGVAETISKETGADLIEIVPKEKYTSADLDWNNSKSRTSIECNDKNSRPDIANSINVDDYNVIYLGYPIWWGDVPHIILTFMDTYKLDGKTVIPFCTSGGTGISESMTTLKNYNKNVNWIEGKRLSSTESEIKNWIESINY